MNTSKVFLSFLLLMIVLLSGCVGNQKEHIISEPALGDQYTKIYKGIKEFNSSKGFVKSEIELIEIKQSNLKTKYILKPNEIERIPPTSMILNPEITSYSYYNEEEEQIGGEDDLYISNFTKPVSLWDYPLTLDKEWYVEIEDVQRIKNTNNSFETITRYHFKVESFESIEIIDHEYIAAKISANKILEISDVWGFGKMFNLNRTVKSVTNSTQTYWITSELGIVKKVEKSVDYIDSKKSKEVSISYILTNFEK